MNTWPSRRVQIDGSGASREVTEKSRRRSTRIAIAVAYVALPLALLAAVALLILHCAGVAADTVGPPLSNLLDSDEGVRLSDQEMTSHFLANEQEFERVLEMLRQDTGLTMVGKLAGEWPKDLVAAGIDSDRLAQYDSLLEDLGVLQVERRDDAIVFTASTVGLSISGSSKGYTYSEQTPTPQVGDTALDATDPSGVNYHHIKGNWYIVYEWGT
jgi:hypothetical protein